MTGDLDNAPPARECGECTLCCKLMGVEALKKASGTWCAHCTIGHGCGIYGARPQECRDFLCAWLQNHVLDERWKPSLCKFVMFAEPGSVNLKVTVDPTRPDAWRKEPFYSHFKAWTRQRIGQGGKVLVMTGKRTVAVLPDRDVDLGVCNEDDRVITVRAETELGPLFDVLKVHKNDPRAQGAADM